MGDFHAQFYPHPQDFEIIAKKYFFRYLCIKYFYFIFVALHNNQNRFELAKMAHNQAYTKLSRQAFMMLALVLCLMLLPSGSLFLRAQEPVQDSAVKAGTDSTDVRPLLAVSTNLLYDLAITPNLAIEIPIGRHWSVYGEYTFPWWVTSGNDRAWQIQKWDLGGRYWFHNPQNRMDVLKGHFIGLDLTAGYYDIEPHHNGWQGEAVAATLEYGYSWILGKKKVWRLDLTVGAGWMGTEYRYYKADESDQHLLYQYTGRFNWWGPTKVGLSLKYLFKTKTRRAAR